MQRVGQYLFDNVSININFEDSGGKKYVKRHKP